MIPLFDRNEQHAVTSSGKTVRNRGMTPSDDGLERARGIFRRHVRRATFFERADAFIVLSDNKKSVLLSDMNSFSFFGLCNRTNFPLFQNLILICCI